MATIGENGYVYEMSGDDFGALPDGWGYHETGGVAVDSNDNVYVFNRSDHPVIVLDRDGNFLRSMGGGRLHHAPRRGVRHRRLDLPPSTRATTRCASSASTASCR